MIPAVAGGDGGGCIVDCLLEGVGGVGWGRVRGRLDRKGDGDGGGVWLFCMWFLGFFFSSDESVQLFTDLDGLECSRLPLEIQILLHHIASKQYFDLIVMEPCSFVFTNNKGTL